MTAVAMMRTARSWRRGTRLVIQLAVFQAAWFACVLGAAADQPWIGVAAVAAVVVWHVRQFPAGGPAESPRRRAIALVGLALAIGVVWDTLLAAAGWVVYAAPGPLGAPWAPAWILALWALFATTLGEPMRWLHGRPFTAAAFGAIGGPLSYAAAARLGACSFPDPTAAMAVLAVGWGVVVPMLIGQAREGRRVLRLFGLRRDGGPARTDGSEGREP